MQQLHHRDKKLFWKNKNKFKINNSLMNINKLNSNSIMQNNDKAIHYFTEYAINKYSNQ
jgi:hypothetical protein